MANVEGTRTGATGESKLSRLTVGRLSLYLRRLEQLSREGVATVSSSQLGEALGVSDAQVRKDLASLGHLGQPGVGYAATELTAAIRRKLGLDRSWAVVLVGAGNLARALLRYRGFRQQGFNVVAVIDSDPSKSGQQLAGLTIEPAEKLAELVATGGVELGIIAVPAENAQDVAQQMVSAGIKGILNFAPAIIRVPEHVNLVSVDLTVQLEQLAFLVQQGSED